ncbi:MAG: 5'-methylthioadenosine/adenosylhomocysteine nucleosidase [Lachnospiraceae bacterium]|nr:5'-methylthioadenosine/adenosylhomocysteine nucleosidase [Lachnospiraceae bacterium]
MSKIGIIGAMELEVETLKSKMQVTRKLVKANMEFNEGTLNGAEVVIVRSGIGKVNAALCVQVLADIFEVTHIINTGVAGSLNSKLDIGDILISKIALHHDMDATNFGYPLGEVPQMGIKEFPADEKMIELAEATCAEVLPELHTLVGRVVSGDQFIADKDVKNKLITNFSGDCCEMEGASIAHGSYLNKIPFVILRAISDKADDSAQMDYPTFERHAAEHCAKLVEALVAKL